MGMSASQARLIALTARMNDIEYQGQQINQQRTTLANQINALYSSLLDMSVPTPPSTQDYTKIVYSGTKGAARFDVGIITPGTEAGTYNVDLEFTKTGHSWDSQSFVTVQQGAAYYEKYDMDSISNPTIEMQTLSNQINVPAGGFTDLSDEELNDEIYVKMNAADLAGLGLDKRPVYTIDANNSVNEFNGSASDLGNQQVVVQLNRSDLLKTDEGNAILAKYPTPEVYDNLSSEYVINPDAFSGFSAVSSTGATVCDVSDVIQIDQKTGRVSLDSGYTLAKLCENTRGVVNEDGTAKEGYIAVGDINGYTVKVRGTDTPLQNAEDLFSGLGSEKSKAYIDGLKNKFPGEYRDCKSDAEFLALFKGYKYQTESGTEVYRIMKISDINTHAGQSVDAYEYVANGTFTATEPNEGCKLEFDTNGRITKLLIPNETGGYDPIDLSSKEVKDEDAYKDAFNQYEYEKYLYDKQQKEINAKTSIVQAEDKNLELKLTRLDNERNAVNTEIEAVKKVVGDNIEKSFKTFSG